MNNRRSIRLLLHFSAGGVLVLVSFLADSIRGLPFEFGPGKWTIVVAGLVIILLGFIAQTGAVARFSETLCMVIVSVSIVPFFLEGVFRLIGFDFAREEEAWRKMPPYYRQPIVPFGEVFFRRPGPEQWTGQVLKTVVIESGISPNPYGDEPTVTVKYNQMGFRNEENFSDWEVAVAGDSFTELGDLTYDKLFTTILGKMLNIRVLNLGVSRTGPLTQLSYLQHLGVAPSTKHVVIVFYEGNDLSDLRDEYAALVQYHESGHREYRQFKTQTSMLKALFTVLQTLWSNKKPSNAVHAQFKSAHGDIPISIGGYTPPNKAQVPAETMQQLEYFFRKYADFAKSKGIKAWLAYMPRKLRVVYDRIEFTQGATESQKKWKPSDLPQAISEISDRYGIEFIDLTPALVEETNRTGELLYNSIFDIHLNSRGSLIVAKELARHLSAPNSSLNGRTTR
jgi:hypothetical protein